MSKNGQYKLWDFADHRLQSLVFKLTEQCNLGCDYCYRGGIKRSPAKMTLLTIRNSTKSFADWINLHFTRERPMYLIWHGGEPLICGIEYFEEIFRIENEYRKNGYTIRNAIQTNGTLINQKWVDLFKKYDVLVGISIDGPQSVNDIHRHYTNTYSSFAATMKGLKFLAKNEYKYSCISVVSNETVDMLSESLDFFVNEGFNTVDFIPSFLHNNPSTLNGDCYADSMIKLYDYWKSKYPDQIYIRFLGDIEGKILDNTEIIGCELAGCCGENFSVNVEGEVYPCECISTFKELSIGNINCESFNDMLANGHFSDWKRMVNEIDNFCIYSCECFDVCKGGCFNRRYCGNGKVLGKDIFCSPRYKIINHISKVCRRKNDE